MTENELLQLIQQAAREEWTELDLSGNDLTVLPPEIGQLTSLQSLDLSRNNIQELPPEIQQLPNLKKLDLRGNPLPIPPEILEGNNLFTDPGDIQEILDFYFRIQDPTETAPLYEAKFIIVGEGAAGKTTLAKKIERETYKLQPDEKSTQGIDVIQWHFSHANREDFRVNIWDFGGQEIYHQTHQFFLTKRSLYALVADDRKENTDFYWWLKVVELLSDNSPVLIIKNEKQDRQCPVNERQLRGEFTNLKDVIPANFATNRGLTAIKDAIEQYITRLPHVGNPLPKLWVRVRAALENDSRNYITQQDYDQICRRNQLTDRQDMRRLSRYLHDLGVCLHFQDDPTLKHYIILKPEWGTSAVYNVLDNPTVQKNLGCFTQDTLADIWQDAKYNQMQDELLQLMIRFKLCYPIPNQTNTYIAPQLLDINQPDYDWDEQNNLILRYDYEFMPKGILTRFIVETHPWIENQTLVWRSGVILNKDQTRAEIIEYYYQRQIKIRVSGNRKKELLAVITHELEKIHESYERLRYNTLVPCNCPECLGSPNPYSYPLDKLRKRLNAGRYEIECDNSYQMVDVRRLIDEVNLSPYPQDHADKLGIDSPFDKATDSRLQQELNQEREASFTHPHRQTSAKDSLMNEPNAANFEKEIFISYAWRGESEEFVNRLDEVFQSQGITIVRDKRDLDYKGLIKEFMQRIGKGKFVIVVISDRYLKSKNCMYELVQIAKNGEFYNRIFPIVLSDANIYDPIDRADYIIHWQEQIDKLENKIKLITSSANLPSLRSSIDEYTEIRATIDGLTDTLQNMNTLTPDIHSESGFNILINAIQQQIYK
ncbi:MAG: COR domain-containing protein [Coleofasciculus chthonoplastes F3-SA18-01]|uniref:COR domain-containing protein n=1 Tax=Coleofasciculus chthonoplastes TaxID=64178 RepID=UPI0032F634D2